MSAAGRNCRYYLRGACVYREARNPGHEPAFGCRRLAALGREWDSFLDSAEAFRLSEKEAARIWDARRHPALTDPRLCPVPSVDGGRPEPDGNVPILDCPHLLVTACLLAMPGCPGVCSLYRAREP